MELVLISKSRGTRARLKLSWFKALVSSIMVGAVIGGVAYRSFNLGSDHMADAILTNPEIAANFWQREIVAQRRLLQDMRMGAQADLSALAGKIGTLQGHIVRLDAAAGRLISQADLDPLEFNFEKSPAVGGPAPVGSAPPSWSQLLANVEALSRELEVREERLTALESLLLGQQLESDMRPSGRPLDGGWMSSGYGYRTDPVSGMREFHNGIDFAGRIGTEVKAVGAGVVTWAGRRWGYGNVVEINHGNGYVTRYAHNRKSLVSIGDKISKDQAIAVLGSSGRSTGPHVHFEVLFGDRVVNPWKFIKETASPKQAAVE
jgi:murein DD-endopeptidase MepM/ murein hydrolase activator NlpD